MFEELAKAFTPSMMQEIMLRVLSPMQRALITQLPKAANQIYDMRERSAPKIRIQRNALTVFVAYEFPTEQDAIAFLMAETSTLDAVNTIAKAMKQGETK